MRRSALSVCRIAIAAVLAFAPSAEAGFHRADVGDVIENVALPALSGGRQPLLGQAAVNVFVFFKPGQEHSLTTLTKLAGFKEKFAGKSVHWAAVASDRFKLVDIEATVQAAGFSMSVLIDTGDELYGRLGVALCPTIGITDRRHQLVADLSFAKVNYAAVISGHIRHQLQEISSAKLQDILNPTAAVQGGDAKMAHRRLKYAEKLFQAGKHARALENVQASLAKDPNLAAARVLQERILSAQGRSAESVR